MFVFCLHKGGQDPGGGGADELGFDLEAPHWPDKGPSSSSLLPSLSLCGEKGSFQLLRLL